MSLKLVILYSILALAFATVSITAAEEKVIVEKKPIEQDVKTEKLVGASSFNLVSTLGQYGHGTPVQTVAVATLPDVVAPYYANHYTYSKYLVPSIPYGHGHGHGHGHGLQYGYGYPNIGYYGHGHGHGHGHGNGYEHSNLGYGYGTTIGHILAYNTYRPTAYHQVPHVAPGHYTQPPIYYTHNYNAHGNSLGVGHGVGHGLGHGFGHGHGLRHGNYGQSYGVPLYNNRHHRFGLYH